MPELPEVETMRRGVQPVVGGRIAAAEACPCECRPILIAPRIPALAKRVVGQRIEATDRLGTRVLLRLESGDVMIFEPRMTGLVLLADPPDAEHLRFRLQIQGAKAKELWYWDRRGLGSVRLVTAEELARLGEEKLGPDALQISAETLRERLSASSRAIKVALLDQKAVAGIGNLYASEILHLAAISPKRSCRSLKIVEWLRIHEAIREVLEMAIRYEGSTLRDGTYRNALNQSGGYQNHHRVYDRAGEECPRCGGGPIRRIVQAQRATFFCPACQRRATM